MTTPHCVMRIHEAERSVRVRPYLPRLLAVCGESSGEEGHRLGGMARRPNLVTPPTSCVQVPKISAIRLFLTCLNKQEAICAITVCVNFLLPNCQGAPRPDVLLRTPLDAKQRPRFQSKPCSMVDEPGPSCCETGGTISCLLRRAKFFADAAPTLISLPLSIWSDLSRLDLSAVICFLTIWSMKEFIIKFAGSPTSEGHLILRLTGIARPSSSEQMSVYRRDWLKQAARRGGNVFDAHVLRMQQCAPASSKLEHPYLRARVWCDC